MLKSMGSDQEEKNAVVQGQVADGKAENKDEGGKTEMDMTT